MTQRLFPEHACYNGAMDGDLDNWVTLAGLALVALVWGFGTLLSRHHHHRNHHHDD